VLLALTEPDRDPQARATAAEALGRLDDPRAGERLVALGREPEAPDGVLYAIVGRLAGREGPASRDAAVAILTRPGVADHVIRSVWPAGREAVWQAWRATGDPRLLVQLAYCGDRRAGEPLASAIVDAAQPDEIREWLVRYAAWPREPSVIPALRAAAAGSTAPLLPIADALLALGAVDDAIAVFSRAIREDDPIEQAAQKLGWVDAPAAGDALLVLFAERPSATLAVALGWFASDEAARALRDAAADPRTRLAAAIDGLERMASTSALDALLELARGGDRLAARALARRRDPRVRGVLMSYVDADPDAMRDAVEGLRDLRDGAPAPILLDVVRATTDDDDLVAVAAHALVAVDAPQAPAAIEHLAAAGNPALRRLAESWREPG